MSHESVPGEKGSSVIDSANKYRGEPKTGKPTRPEPESESKTDFATLAITVTLAVAYLALRGLFTTKKEDSIDAIDFKDSEEYHEAFKRGFSVGYASAVEDNRTAADRR